MKFRSIQQAGWTRIFPPLTWLAEYKPSWLRHDAIAGVTLAAYAIPVSLAYAGLAGLPPQVGIYGYMLGGLGYALLGSSRQLAVGPTSAISLMIAGSVGALAGGDAIRFAQIASLSAFAVALLCLIAWLFKLSILIRLVSDSILVGFKAGAGLTIIMSQLPSLFGVAGGGHNFFDRAIRLAGQVGDVNLLVLAIGVAAIVLLLLGERFLTGRPVGLAVVALSILMATLFGLPALGVPVTGNIPEGLPAFGVPTFGMLEFQELFPIAAGCLLLAYIEGVSAARSFAAKHGYSLDVRQEFLGLGAANLAVAFGHGYPVAGGLSQSAVNDAAGARTSAGIGVLLVCPRALPAVLYGIADQPSQGRAGWHCLCCRLQAGRHRRAASHVASKPYRLLCRGYRAGVGTAAWNPPGRAACRPCIDLPAAWPGVAAQHRVSRAASGTGRYSDSARHEGVEPLVGVIAFRPEASLLYINAETILETVLQALRKSPEVTLVVCDLSASPYIDLAGARMLLDLHDELASRHVALCIVGAHAQLRDLLRAEGLAEKTDSGQWLRTLDSVLGESNAREPSGFHQQQPPAP